MSEMVERVARALYEARGANSFPWETRIAMADDLSVGVVGLHRDLARSAIEEMREPDEAMKTEAWRLITSNLRYEEAYRHLIDAALGK